MSERKDDRLWGGRFERAPNEEFDAFQRSFAFDRRLLPYEIAVDRAWARALEPIGIFTATEVRQTLAALDKIAARAKTDAECLEPPGIRFRSRCNFVERSQRLPHLRGRENADRFKSPGPGAVHGNFVRQETTIKGKRALERVELFVRCALEASAPQSVVFAFAHEKVFSP